MEKTNASVEYGLESVHPQVHGKFSLTAYKRLATLIRPASL